MEFWRDGSVLALICVVLALVAAIQTNWVIMAIAVIPAVGSAVLARRNHRKLISQNEKRP